MITPLQGLTLSALITRKGYEMTMALSALLGFLTFGWGMYWIYIVASSPLEEDLRWYDVLATVCGAVIMVSALGG